MPFPALAATDRLAPTPAPGRRRLSRRLRLWAWRLRLPTAALLVGCAVAVTVGELRPSPPPTAPIVVAARELPAGTRLAAADVRLVAVPVGLAPDGARHAVDDVVGSVTSVVVPAGLAVAGGVLAGPGPTGPPGTVVVPVRLGDPAVARILTPGMHVDVVAAVADATGQAGAGRTLARRAVVVAGAAGSDDDAGGPGGGLLGGVDDAAEEALVLLAVGPEEAQELAGASGWTALTAVFVP